VRTGYPYDRRQSRFSSLGPDVVRVGEDFEELVVFRPADDDPVADGDDPVGVPEVELARLGLREPFELLYRYVLPTYWRTGLARWWKTWRRFVPDLRSTPPPGIYIAGDRDAIPDRTRVNVSTVPGAHACTFSHPREVAEAIGKRVKPQYGVR